MPRVQGRLCCKSGGLEERAHEVALLLAAAGTRGQALTRHPGLRRQNSSTRARPGTCAAARQTGQQTVQLPFAAVRGMACLTLGSQQSSSSQLFPARTSPTSTPARAMAQQAVRDRAHSVGLQGSGTARPPNVPTSALAHPDLHSAWLFQLNE